MPSSFPFDTLKLLNMMRTKVSKLCSCVVRKETTPCDLCCSGMLCYVYIISLSQVVTVTDL